MTILASARQPPIQLSEEAAGGANDSADSLALYAGGGVNVHLKNRLALRAIEANWLRTQMPNATTNVQNNLRLGAGLIYTFK